ncbi:hypothetical protein, partial [Klebsiella pneumoniae]|uniref:hypothetical protein n=1 Tax=Klebsiella pneumoniae TaxID=573 RepID=UPI001C8F81C2
VIPDVGAGIPELRQFQAHLNKYKITVYNFNSKGREVYFNGENPNALYKLDLLFHEGHFNLITSLTAVFSCAYFCEDCHIPYDHKNAHRCKNICPACLTI